MMSALKWLLLLASTKLISGKLAGQTDCCVTIVGGNELVDVDEQSDSDPYVVLYGKYDGTGINSVVEEYTTSIKWDDENPRWNEMHCMNNIDYDYFYFQVHDKDNLDNDDFMGDTNWYDLKIEDLECCDTTQKIQLSLQNAAGYIDVIAACDYNCNIQELNIGDTTTTTKPPVNPVNACGL